MSCCRHLSERLHYRTVYRNFSHARSRPVSSTTQRGFRRGFKLITCSSDAGSASSSINPVGESCNITKSIDEQIDNIDQKLEDLELPSLKKEKWGLFAAYLLWLLLVCLQLFRADLVDMGVPDPVIDVAVSGTTAALALSWDQLVSGPRRTKMARMEAMINSKLDTQERLSRRRDEAEADIRARLEVSERLQQERARVEDQISAKLDAEMQALVQFREQVMQGQVQAMDPVNAHPAVSSQKQPKTLESPLAPMVLPVNLSMGLSNGSTTSRTASREGSWETGDQVAASFKGMNAQLSQVSVQPSQNGDGSVSLNIQITLAPMRDAVGDSDGSGRQ